MFRSLLIAVDLSPASARVVRRAGFLPVVPGGKRTLLHVVPQGFVRATRLRAAADARQALGALADGMAHGLAAGVAAARVVKAGAAAAEIAGEALARGADLIVLGRGRHRLLHDAFLGSTAERVVRRTRMPVLVVRSPADGLYRRPLLALDRDRAARAVLDTALRMLPPPRPALAIVHAYEIPYDGTVYRSLATDRAATARRAYRQRALREMAEVVGVAGDEALRFTWHVRHGSPRSIVPQTAKRVGADLLALGTHGYAGMAHALLGTVAGDVLRSVGCDALVVPPGTARTRG